MAEKEITLRPYQEECEKVIDEKGDGKFLIAMATGLGKTAIMTHIKRKGRVLILSHRDELVRQPEKYYDCSFGVEKAGERAEDEEVVSASVQTLMHDSRLKRFSPDAFHTIIVGEAHHAAAPSYKKILNYFTGASRRIGFTATPKRGDGVNLSDVFDEIIFSRDLRWGIENKYLSRIRCLSVTSDYSLKNVGKVAGDYSQAQLDSVLSKGECIPAAAKVYIEKCHNAGKHTLIYCVNLHICGLMYNTLAELLPNEEMEKIKIVEGKTPDDERRQILDDFMSGRVMCIINCMVLTEGTDLPIADAVINLRPTCNDSLYQQMVGRGTRLYEGKKYCLIIDMVPKDRVKSRNLCTAPSLFGVDANYMNKNSLERLNEDTDLLDLCTEASPLFADRARRLELQIEAFNLFMDERKELIKKHTDAKALAQEYTKMREDLRNEDDEWNFGSLDVSVGADEEKYYKITPSWNEEFFLSKPDVLGNTTLTCNVKCVPGYGHSSELDVSSYQGQMKMEDAIELIRKYCECCGYGYSWDRNVQRGLATAPITDKQKVYLIREMTAAGGPTKGVWRLNKLEATRLIDMMKEMKKLQTEKKAVSKEKEKAEADLKKAPLRCLLPDNESSEIDGDAVIQDAMFKKFEEQVEKEYKAYDREKTAAQAAMKQNLYVDENGSYLKYQIPHTVKLMQRRVPASPKQKSFINGLILKNKTKGITFSGFLLEMLTKRQASCLIDFLLTFDNFPNTEKQICFEITRSTLDKMDSDSSSDVRFYYTENSEIAI